MTSGWDVLVVGGGIAGMGAAAALAEGGATVLLAERETTLTHHTTGRSAALWIRDYGGAAIRDLAVASRTELEPFLSPRAMLIVARHDQLDRLDHHHREAVAAGSPASRLTTAEAVKVAPLLRPEVIAGAVQHHGAADIDVAALHEDLRRRARRSGARIETTWPVLAAEHTAGGRWRVRTAQLTIDAGAVLNAAGAWGDEVAASAGVVTIGLQPLRRTIFTVAGAAHTEGSAQWPAVIDVDEQWYVKPEGEQFLCSPADETPTPPCDARPEELDVALGIERVNRHTTLNVRAIRTSWAGLRTFSPDRNLIIGPDPAHPGWHWLVGQGGYGIQTAPAAGRLAAALITGQTPPLDPTPYLPVRLR